MPPSLPEARLATQLMAKSAKRIQIPFYLSELDSRIVVLQCLTFNTRKHICLLTALAPSRYNTTNGYCKARATKLDRYFSRVSLLMRACRRAQRLKGEGRRNTAARTIYVFSSQSAARLLVVCVVLIFFFCAGRYSGGRDGRGGSTAAHRGRKYRERENVAEMEGH